MNLGKAVRYARMECHLNQNELSDMTGLSNSYLSQIENGHNIGSIQAMTKIAWAVGMKLSELIDYAEALSCEDT